MQKEKQYPSIYHHLSTFSTEKKDRSKETAEEFDQWKDQILFVIHRSIYSGFHGALADAVQREEFRFLMAELLRIYDKAQKSFAGVKILEVRDVKVFLTLDGFVLSVEDEVKEISLAENEQQGINDFFTELHSIPGIFSAMKKDTAELLDFIKQNSRLNERILECLPSAIAAFAAALKDLCLQNSEMLEEVQRLQESDEEQWKSGLTLINSEGIKINLSGKILYVLEGRGQTMQAKALKIFDENFADQLTEILKPYGRIIFNNLPTTLEEVKEALMEMNPINEEFVQEDTNPGI